MDHYKHTQEYYLISINYANKAGFFAATVIKIGDLTRCLVLK